MGGDPTVDLFFYGTLRDPEVRRIVLGTGAARLGTLPAVARGYRCAPVSGGRFPVLVPDAAGRAEGLVVAGVDPAAAARTSFFEDEGYDYRAAPLAVVTASGVRRTAWAFLSSGRLAPGAGPWVIAAWRQRHRRAFIATARRAMAQCRGADLDGYEAAWRVRAAAAAD